MRPQECSSGLGYRSLEQSARTLASLQGDAKEFLRFADVANQAIHRRFQHVAGCLACLAAEASAMPGGIQR
jgi:hypothetical protein